MNFFSQFHYISRSAKLIHNHISSTISPQKINPILTSFLVLHWKKPFMAENIGIHLSWFVEYNWVKMSNLWIGQNFFFSVVKYSDVEEGRSIPTSSVTEKDFRSSEGPVIQVGRQPGWGHLNQLVIVGNIFSQTRENHLKLNKWKIIMFFSKNYSTSPIFNASELYLHYFKWSKILQLHSRRI